MKRLIILCFALILAAASYLGLAATGTIDDPETKEFAVRTLGLSTNASAAPQDINSNSLDDVSADKASAGSTADAATTGAPTVSVTRVSNSSFVGRVLLTGSFVAREQILLTPEIDGVRIIEISTEAGDMVEKGQVLARLQRVPIEAELAANQAADQRLKAERRQVQSQLSEADAVLAEADKALKRAKSLKTSGFLSDSVFDQRETALQTARARAATASDGLALIDARLAENAANRQAIAWRLSQTEVTAPVAGRIAKRNARVGARVVQGGEPLFEITEDGDVEVMADVDDTQIGKLKLGQNVEVQTAGDVIRRGTIRLISPQIDPATRLGKVRIALPDNSGLRIGGFARTTVETERSFGPSVPLSAIIYGPDGPSVHTVVANRVVSKQIELGIHGDDAAEVRSGLTVGDLVVTRSGTFLRDGDTIRPMLQEQRISGASSSAPPTPPRSSQPSSR